MTPKVLINDNCKNIIIMITLQDFKGDLQEKLTDFV